jgi:hypothetical protein
MCVYIYIYIYTYVCVYIYMYIYIYMLLVLYQVQGKRLVVELSMDQDTVFFGNLCKGKLHSW